MTDDDKPQNIYEIRRTGSRIGRSDRFAIGLCCSGGRSWCTMETHADEIKIQTL